MAPAAGEPGGGSEDAVPPEAAAAPAAAAAGPPAAAPPVPPEGQDAVESDEEWASGEEEEDEDEGFDGWFDHEVDDEDWEMMGELEEDEDMGEMDELMDESGSSDGEEDAGIEARVAAETSGRHVHGDWATYSIPTVSHHFQSADALSVVQLPASAGGGVLAATFDAEGLAAWLLPAAGSLEKLGADSQPAARRLGGFQAPRDIYSMSLSPCGRWIATGGEGGLLCIYSLDPSAPPRRPTGGRKPQLQGLNYLFTPHRPLGGLMAHVVERAPQAMQSLAATLLAGPTAQSLSAALGGAAGGGAAGPQLLPQQQQMLEQALSALFTHTLHGDFHDLAVESAQSAVQEQLQRLRETSAALAAEAAELRELPAAGQERLAALLQQMSDNAEAQVNAELRLQALQQRLEPQAMRNTAALAGVRAGVAGKQDGAADAGGQSGDAQAGKHPAAPAEPAQQQRQEDAVPPAALVLRGIFSLGLEPAQAQRVPFLSDGMTNGVRWGTIAGQLRLLAADQSQYVYIFERPQPGPPADAAGSSSSGSSSAAGELQPEHMLCGGLGEASPSWCMRPVNFFRTQQHALGARVSQQFPPADAGEQPLADAPAAASGRSQRAAAAAASAAWAPLAKAAAGRSIGRGSPYMTAALGPFPVPCNLAAASPDGRWVAVAGDSQCVFLCDQAAGFARRQLPYDLAGSRDNVEPGLEAGAQYLAWNASSNLLAVSSDALHAVFVFDPHAGRLVLRVEGHRHPCLCVGFAPWDDRLLLYSEESKNVHLRRVPRESDAAAGSSRASGSGGSGPDDGGEGQQQGAAPPAAALFEQNAEDDFGDARPGYQLLRLPILPQEPGAQLPVGMSNRRRRVNGMALTPDGDLLLATKQGRVLRFLASQPWALQQHATWPPAFKAAACALLCCAHRQPPAGAGTGLWSLPLPLLQHIVELLAGSRMDWLNAGAVTGSVQQDAPDGRT